MSRCKYFKKTGIKAPVEKECLVCTLRNKKGDCLKDIYGDKFEKCAEEANEEASEIWRRFYKEEK